ncbi:MAG: AtpZ/AtpI family protein [Sphingomicrobium sp.]|nr:AtpZ/AtpI family protein [Sphingomonadales bacterium]
MAADETGEQPGTSQDARLESLDERLRRAERVEAERTGRASAESQRVIRTAGMRILQDLVGLPFGGALIGWLVDRWLHTAPWVMLAMLFLGFGIAVRNVMQVSKDTQGK